MKVFHPRRGRAARARLRAGGLHRGATSTSTAGCARRSATWSRSQLRHGAREVARDARWMSERGMSAGARARWLPRAAAHQMRPAGGVRRSDRAPSGCPTACSGCSRWRGAGARRRRVVSRATAAARRTTRSSGCTATGPAPLEEPVPGMAERTPLHVAVVIPAVRAGSGGHNTIFTLVDRLERAGHTCSLWMYDAHDRHRRESAAVLRRRMRRGVRAPARAGVQGLRRLARRRRRARDRLGHRVPGAAPAPAARSRLPDPGPRAGVLRHLGGGAVGGAHLRAGPLRHLRPGAGCATCSRAATGRTAAGSGWASTTASTSPGPESSGGATRCSSTRAQLTSRRAVPLGAARPGRSCTRRRPDRAS